MPLALRGGAGDHGDAAVFVDPHHRALVGHGGGGLDVVDEADAEVPALGPQPRLLAPRRGEIEGFQGQLHAAREVSAVVVDRPPARRAEAGGVGMPVGGDEIAAPQLEGIGAELPREGVEGPLDHRGAVGPARPTIGAHGRGRGHHAAEAEIEIGNDVRPHRMDHGVLRQVQPRDRVRAHVVEEIVAQGEEPALPGGRQLHVVDLVTLHAGDEGVLPPRLDPLDRPVELAREGRDHDVLRVVHSLGAEAAAHVGGRDHAHLLLGQAELPGDHPAVTMDHLDGAPHGQALVRPADDEAARLQGMRAAAREPDPRPDDHVRGADGGLHVAHALAPLRHDIAGRLLVQDGRARGERRVHVHEGGEGLVLDPDQVEGVPGAIGIIRDDRGHGLADEAHALAGQGPDPAGHRQGGVRGVDGDGHPGAPEIGSEEDADDAGRAASRRHIDGADAGMRVRRAQHYGVQAAGHAEVVDELSGAGDEPWILAAADASRVLGHVC